MIYNQVNFKDSLIRHIQLVHKNLVRKERDAREASCRDGLLSHLNTTLTQTARSNLYAPKVSGVETSSESVAAESSDKTFKRFSSDSNLTVGNKRPSVYSVYSKTPVLSLPEQTTESSNQDDVKPFETIIESPKASFSITYKTTPTRSTPKKVSFKNR